MDFKLFFYNQDLLSIQQNHKRKTHALVKLIYPEYYYYTIVCNFFFPHFSIRIFPSGSVTFIRRYTVRVLQTPVSRGVDYKNNIKFNFIYLKTKTPVEHDIGLAPVLVIWGQQIRAYLRLCNPQID